MQFGSSKLEFKRDQDIRWELRLDESMLIVNINCQQPETRKRESAYCECQSVAGSWIRKSPAGEAPAKAPEAGAVPELN